MKRSLNILFSALSLVTMIDPARACVTYAYSTGGHNYFAKGFMWNDDSGAVLVNPRLMRKKALGLNEGDRGAVWDSKYGNLTFNQIAREFPYGGVNEAGLAVEVLWWDGTSTPLSTDPRPSVNESQWIQYILDTSANIQEAIENAKKVRISKFFAAVHYMACDSSGACAVFENIDHEIRAYMGDEFQVKYISNDSNVVTQGYFEQFAQSQGLTLKEFMAKAPTSPELMATVKGHYDAYRADLLFGNVKPEDAVKAGLEPIKDTEWQIVYDLTSKVVNYRSKSFMHTKTIDLKKVDFQCRSISDGLNLSYDKEGDATSQIGTFSIVSNFKLLKAGLS